MANTIQIKLFMKSISPSNLKSVIRHLTSKQLVIEKFGDPLNVVKIKENSEPALGNQDVLVRMLAAPINPSDINTIEGKYPVKLKLPLVLGNEGVGTVEDIGKDVNCICPGNKVIFIKPAQGTWRTHGIFKQNVLKQVPEDIDLAAAATLTVNPCAAYRMLCDFKPVQEKNLVVMQNGGNSACGQNVIQLCKNWSVKNISIVRERPNIKELKEYLKCLGATYVLTEQELKNTSIFKKKEIDKPTLALNCVGGNSALAMIKHIQPSGCMVTYGGMSKKPVIIPTGAFIFKNISFLGFWLTAWTGKAKKADQDRMLTDIVNLMSDNKLVAPPHKMIKFSSFKKAISASINQTSKGYKYILDFDSC